MKISKETLQYIKENREKDLKKLSLEKRTSKDIDYTFALQQIKGWQYAKHKLPFLHQYEGIIYPVHLSLEQCSSEHTAKYKADLVIGDSFIDLTGGFGIDFIFMSETSETAIYVERDKDLCAIAMHNLSTIDRHNCKVINADSEGYLKVAKDVDCIYLDPARRDTKGGKIAEISQCEPNVKALESTLTRKAKRVIVKLSPMFDMTKAINDLNNVAEVHIVSVENECKELIIVLERHIKDDIRIHCVNIKKAKTEIFAYNIKEEKEGYIGFENGIRRFIYEPNSSIMKAGCFKSIQKYNPELSKLHPNTHLFASDIYISDFQGRCFEVVGICDVNRKSLQAHAGDISKANLSIRNFPMSVNELKKKLKLNDGGETYIFAITTYDNKHKLIICRKKTDS